MQRSKDAFCIYVFGEPGIQAGGSSVGYLVYMNIQDQGLYLIGWHCIYPFSRITTLAPVVIVKRLLHLKV